MTSYLLRPMRHEDLPQVLDIDETSFPTPWSARTYQFELTNRGTSHLVVLEFLNHRDDQPHSLHALLQRLRGTSKPAPTLAGYGGCWLIAGESHVSTLAVQPAYRGRGLGELLLAGMLQRTVHLGGEYSVLEVRVSNLAAQALYRKYEYETIGRRRGYYRDNGEDAFLMEVRPLDERYRQRLDQRVEALRERVDYLDQFSAV